MGAPECQLSLDLCCQQSIQIHLCLVTRGYCSEGVMPCFCQTPGHLAPGRITPGHLASTHLSHFCPGCQESHTEFNTLWTMIYPAFLINYAFISFICFTSLTFSLSSNCSVGHRFTRDFELLWAINTSKYLQAVYLLLRHNIGSDTKYPQMHNITLLWS